MSREVQSVPSDCTLLTALALMRHHGIRHLLVADADRLAGLVSNRDFRVVLDWIGPDGRIARFADATVRDIMTPADRLVMVEPHWPLPEIARLFIDRKVGVLPVERGGRAVGVISVVDVLRALLPH
jgi:acetoin utilization protein AcuB